MPLTSLISSSLARKSLKLSFALFLFLAGFASTANALVITMADDSTTDYVTLYRAGFCIDKFSQKESQYYTWDRFNAIKSPGLTLTEGETICIHGHGSPNSIFGQKGQDIANALIAKVANPGAYKILLMACSSGVQNTSSSNPGSAVSNLASVLSAKTGWKGTTVNGVLGTCTANSTGDAELYSTVELPGASSSLKCNSSAQSSVWSKIVANFPAFGTGYSGCIGASTDIFTRAQCIYGNKDIDGAVNAFANSADLKVCRYNPATKGYTREAVK